MKKSTSKKTFSNPCTNLVLNEEPIRIEWVRHGIKGEATEKEINEVLKSRILKNIHVLEHYNNFTEEILEHLLKLTETSNPTIDVFRKGLKKEVLKASIKTDIVGILEDSFNKDMLMKVLGKLYLLYLYEGHSK